MGETKKVGPTGRFGVRYGVGIRKKLLKVETLQIQKQKCPQCGAPALKRKSKGIFKCRKCSHEFVGGAYLPKTLTGGIIRQMVSQKRFVPEMIEQLSGTPTMEEAKEGETKEEKKATKESPVADTHKDKREKKEPKKEKETKAKKEVKKASKEKEEK
ncbi:50S ribosomal protein L37Ae [archaeon]|nr:50S ribosomal protein L37Ae [archaeon]